MKKVLSFIFVLLILITTPVYASILPSVQQSRNQLYPDNQTPIHSPQVRYMLTVRPGFTSVNAVIVVENTDTINPADLTMAVPTIMENNYTVSQLSASTNNSPLKVYTVTGVPSPEKSDKVLYDQLYSWTVSLAPGERKAVNISFTTETKQLIDGTLNLLFPLKQLKLWNGDIDYVEVIADLDYFPAYSFNPNPSPMPDSYADNGRLVWRFYDENFPDEINLSFQSFSSIMNSYFAGPSSEDPLLTQILRDYDSANYDAARLGILNYQLNVPNSAYLNELLFIQALCSIELGYWDDALTLLNQLENKPLYADAHQLTIKNRIIYEKYYLLYYNNLDDAANYISQIAENNKQSSSIFLKWVNSQNTLLNIPAIEETKEETAVQTDLSPVKEPVDSTKTQVTTNSILAFLKLDESIKLFSLSIQRQYLYIGILILIVFILMSFLINKQKHKKKYSNSIRKKYHY